MKIKSGLSKTMLIITVFTCFSMVGISQHAFAKNQPNNGRYSTYWYNGQWAENEMVSRNNGEKLVQYKYDFSSNDNNKLSSFEVCNNFGQDAWFRVWLYKNKGYGGKEQIYTFWVSENACRTVNVTDAFKNEAGSYKFIGRLDRTSKFTEVQITTN